MAEVVRFGLLDSVLEMLTSSQNRPLHLTEADVEYSTDCLDFNTLIDVDNWGRPRAVLEELIAIAEKALEAAPIETAGAFEQLASSESLVPEP